MSADKDFILIAVKVKERTQSSQGIHFNSIESKETVVSVVRYLISVIVNKNSIVSVVTYFILIVVK